MEASVPGDLGCFRTHKSYPEVQLDEGRLMARWWSPVVTPSPEIARRSWSGRRTASGEHVLVDLEAEKLDDVVQEMRYEEGKREGEKTGAGDVVRWPELEILPAATAGRRGRVRRRGGALPRGCGGENGGGRGGFKGACTSTTNSPEIGRISTKFRFFGPKSKTLVS